MCDSVFDLFDFHYSLLSFVDCWCWTCITVSVCVGVGVCVGQQTPNFLSKPTNLLWLSFIYVIWRIQIISTHIRGKRIRIVFCMVCARGTMIVFCYFVKMCPIALERRRKPPAIPAIIYVYIVFDYAPLLIRAIKYKLFCPYSRSWSDDDYIIYSVMLCIKIVISKWNWVRSIICCCCCKLLYPMKSVVFIIISSVRWSTKYEYELCCHVVICLILFYYQLRYNLIVNLDIDPWKYCSHCMQFSPSCSFSSREMPSLTAFLSNSFEFHTNRILSSFVRMLSSHISIFNITGEYSGGQFLSDLQFSSKSSCSNTFSWKTLFLIYFFFFYCVCVCYI